MAGGRNLKDPNIDNPSAVPAVGAPRFLVWGAGAVGLATVRCLLSRFPDCEITLSSRRRHKPWNDQRVHVVGQTDTPANTGDFDVAVLCVESHVQGDAIGWCARNEVPFVSPADDPALIADLGHYPRGRGIVGAGIAPGLSTVLALHAARQMHTPQEIHIGATGASGSSCARQQHALVKAASVNVVGGDTRVANIATGRELRVFPDPIGSIDCVPMASADRDILHDQLPTLERVTVGARLSPSATPRSWVRHAAGMVAAVRDHRHDAGVSVEVRGMDEGVEKITLLGMAGSPVELTANVLMVGTEVLLETTSVRSGAPQGVDTFGTAAPTETLLARLEGVGLRAYKFRPIHA